MRAHESSDPKKVPDTRPVHPAVDTHADGRSTRPPAQLSKAALLTLQRTVGNAAVARLHGEQGAVQRSTVPDVVVSPGQPLAEPVRTEMEDRLGTDFSDVRVHTDEAARHSAAEIGARAYTSGSHVVLGEGGTDRHTLAHELVHVLQQRVGPVSGSDTGHGFQVSDPADRFEREADAVATSALGRAPLAGTTTTDPVTAQTPGTGDAQVQRAPTKRGVEGVEQGSASASKRRRSVSPSSPVMTTEDDDLYDVTNWSDFDPEQSPRQSGQGHVDTEHAQEEQASQPAGEEPPDVTMEDVSEDSYDFSDIDLDELDLVGNPGGASTEQVRAAPEPAPEKKKRNPEEERRQLKNRDSRLRMLDRVARTLIEGMGKGKGVTPHVAVRFDGGALHVEGNEKKPITAAQKGQAGAALKAALDGAFDMKGRDLPPRFVRDAKKFRALLRGTYKPKDLDQEWMGSLASALKSHNLDWGDRTAGNDDGAASKGRDVHAEMNALGDIVAEWRGKARPESDEQATGEDRKPTPVFLGGNKMPCGACRWVIDAVNDIIGKEYGFEVIATRTHGQFYEWDLPQWLTNSTHELDKKVRQEVEKKASLTRREIKDGKLLRAGNASGSHKPPWSDSEGED